MEQLAKAIFENFSAILSGVLAIIGVFVGCLLNLLISEYQNKVRLAFVAESTPNDELTEPELRTKTSPSEWSIRIINTGRTACFLESFEIVRKGRVLVDCYEVCDNHDSIMPNGNILYTLMQQDADAMQHNFSKYYKKPCKAYFSLIHAIQRIPILRNCITNPEFKQGKCKVIAYCINGKKVYGYIDLALLYIRHTARASIISEE